MLKLKTSHGKYVCNKYNFVGHIFQGRFDSVPVTSDVQLKIESRYIHRNPIEFFGDRAILEQYPWSSYHAFTENTKDKFISDKSKRIILDQFNNVKEYIDFVCADEIHSQTIIKETVIAFTKGAA